MSALSFNEGIVDNDFHSILTTFARDIYSPHTGCRLHRDGCDITWQVMLSPQSDYTEGGTYIRALDSIIKLKPGQVLVHPGDLYHKGVDITSGKRTLIVGFMNGFDPKVVDETPPSFFEKRKSIIRHAKVITV